MMDRIGRDELLLIRCSLSNSLRSIPTLDERDLIPTDHCDDIPLWLWCQLPLLSSNEAFEPF
jgi:hypothetical protein